MLAKFPNMAKAFATVYPELPWETHKFMDQRSLRGTMWQGGRNARMFFDEYAQEQGFDPLRAENWYFNLRKMLKKKVIFFHFLTFFDHFLFPPPQQKTFIGRHCGE